MVPREDVDLILVPRVDHDFAGEVVDRQPRPALDGDGFVRLRGFSQRRRRLGLRQRQRQRDSCSQHRHPLLTNAAERRSSASLRCRASARWL